MRQISILIRSSDLKTYNISHIPSTPIIPRIIDHFEELTFDYYVVTHSFRDFGFDPDLLTARFNLVLQAVYGYHK